MNRRASSVLVVEDADFDFEMIARRFGRRASATEIARARGVDDARAWLAKRNDPPAAIILDLHLPDGDGEELLTELKSRPETRGVPVIVWSSAGDPDVPARCLQLGAENFVRKISDGQKAAQGIDSMLSRWWQSLA